MLRPIALALVAVAVAAAPAAAMPSASELFDKLHAARGWTALYDICTETMSRRGARSLQQAAADYLADNWLNGAADRAAFERAYGAHFEDACIDLYAIYYDDQGYFDHLKYSPEDPLSAVKLVVGQCSRYMDDAFKDAVFALV